MLRTITFWKVTGSFAFVSGAFTSASDSVSEKLDILLTGVLGVLLLLCIVEVR
jgi:hypothetical protein